MPRSVALRVVKSGSSISRDGTTGVQVPLSRFPSSRMRTEPLGLLRWIVTVGPIPSGCFSVSSVRSLSSCAAALVHRISVANDSKRPSGFSSNHSVPGSPTGRSERSCRYGPTSPRPRHEDDDRARYAWLYAEHQRGTPDLNVRPREGSTRCAATRTWFEGQARQAPRQRSSLPASGSTAVDRPPYRPPNGHMRGRKIPGYWPDPVPIFLRSLAISRRISAFWLARRPTRLLAPHHQRLVGSLLKCRATSPEDLISTTTRLFHGMMGFIDACARSPV